MNLFWSNQKNRDEIGVEDLLGNAIAYFDNDKQHDPGKLVDEEPPPSDYPISNNIKSLQGTLWRELDTFLDHPDLRAVAYDLTTDLGEEATLYVVADMASIPVAELEERPPREPFNTAEKSASAWKENGKLYVLVVLPPEQYDKFVKQPSGTLAWLDVQPGS